MTENTNTVTIPVDEYFDLRQKGEMNLYLMNTLGELQTRICQLEGKVFDLEIKIK